ncbi:MAG: hypothetical protein OXG53_17180 [Chloroflexi bacterium]|nr:hypothetical protein [Chloroflexota bacterium]
MSKAGKRLLRGAYQALAFAEGKAQPGTYRIHHPDTTGAQISEPITDLDDADILLDNGATEEPATGKRRTTSVLGNTQVDSNLPVTGQQ